MTIYRDALPSEHDDIVDLINYAFGMQAQQSLAKAYGDGEVLESRHKVAVDETTGRIEASVAVYPQTIHVGDGTLHAMFLGCVCVHPRFRGEGHMGRLIRMWHDELRAEGDVDLMVLWGLRHRYAYFGYAPCGYGYTYEINRSCVKHALADPADPRGLAGRDPSRLSFRPLFTRDGDAGLAVRLNDVRLVHAERPLPLVDRIDSYLNSEAVAIDRDGGTIGYLVRATGDPSVVREIALADPADAGSVCARYLESLEPRGKSSFTVKVTPTDAALNERFAGFSETSTIGTVCRCLVFDYARLLECWLPVAARLWRLEPGRLSMTLGGQPVTIGVDGDGSVRVARAADADAPSLSDADAQDLLMGLGARYRRDLPSAPAGWFPLPIDWYWPDLN